VSLQAPTHIKKAVICSFSPVINEPCTLYGKMLAVLVDQDIPGGAVAE